MRKDAGSGILRTAAVLAALCSVLALLWPSSADAIGRIRSERMIDRYLESGSISAERRKMMLESADEYNRLLAQGVLKESGDSSGGRYERELDCGSGIMGWVEIPKIGERLPVRHGTGDEALSAGAGHMRGTSLPCGGKGTHAAIAGHSGLMEGELFSGLERMRKGDMILLHVCGRDMAYRVNDIRTVLPEETESLAIKKNGDLLTLVTCTPYGVNTHRLLVTGERVSWKKSGQQAKTLASRARIYPYLVLSLPCAAVLASALMIAIIWKGEDKK